MFTTSTHSKWPSWPNSNLKMIPRICTSISLLVLLIASTRAVASNVHTDSKPSIRQRLQTSTLQGLTSLEENNDFLGIPGTTQTINGYDTALGNDAMCWRGAAAEQANATSTDVVDELVQTVFPNPLVENFTLQGQTEILKRCPRGNSVTIQKPQESLRGERLRTLRYYNYTLHVEIDLATLDGDYVATDNGTASIALQVVVCSLGKSGFCSPFVHEQANAREAINKVNNREEIKTTEKEAKGDLHGGTHIHSPWAFLDLRDDRILNQNVTIPMIVNSPGDYFVIGTVQLYTGVNGSNVYRWDMANALEAGEGRYVLYQDPPRLKQVTDGVSYFSYAAIGLAGAVIVLLFAYTLWNRNHQVLKLSQGDFLLIFLACALMVTICSFLLMPKNDTYCRISYPMILIPIQLMYAITVGRMWRIHAVISPLLLEHLTKGRPGPVQLLVEGITYISFTMNNIFVRGENKRKSMAGAARQQISQFQLGLVVSLFTFPQIVLQLVALFLQPQELMIDFNEDESLGRYTCGNGAKTSQNLLLYGFLLLFLLVILLLVMAHSSRKLPSLFNETQVIYDSTFLSLVLLLLGGAVIALTDTPETSPDVEYLVAQVLILSIALNPAVRIMWPKLGMVHRNENVVVSKLVTDHHRKAREKESARTGSAPNGVHVSGLDTPGCKYRIGATDYDPSQTNKLVTFHSSSKELAKSSVASFAEAEANSAAGPQDSQLKRDHYISASGESQTSERGNGAHRKNPPFTSSTEKVDVESGESPTNALSAVAEQQTDGKNCDEGVDGGTKDGLSANATRPSLEKGPSSFLKNVLEKGLSWKKMPESSARHVGVKLEEEVNQEKIDESPRKQNKTLHKTILVTEDETPARRLVLKMLDLQDQLEAINNKIMSGLPVTQEDWGTITKLTSKLDRTFNEEVEFEWDVARQCEETLKEVLPDDMSTGGGTHQSEQGFLAQNGKLAKEKRGSGHSNASTVKAGNHRNQAIVSMAPVKNIRKNSSMSKQLNSPGKDDATTNASVTPEFSSQRRTTACSSIPDPINPGECPQPPSTVPSPSSQDEVRPESATSSFEDEGHDAMFFV